MRQKKQATFGLSFIPVLFLIGMLFFATMVNNVWETGWIDVHIPLLLAALVAGLIAVFILGFQWIELEAGIVNLVKSAIGSIIILLIIGIVIGTWLLSGIVPSMIYYGLKILNPSIFLIVTLVMCSIVSLATGSSWTTVATVGIALMGVGRGLGVPSEVIAGAIISGAYFGDKMSPLSDTTNLAPAVAGADLFEHIKHMFYTTVPAYTLSIIVFAVLGFKYAGSEIDQQSVNGMLSALDGAFNISPFLLIVPVVVILLVVMKVPAIPGLFAGGILGAIFAFIFQGSDALAIIDAMHYGFSVETGNEIVDALVSGGGLDGMMWVISLIICALIFGGIMEKTGMLAAMASGVLKYAKRTGDLIITTELTSLLMNFVAGDQYLAIVIPGRMYKEEYDKRGLHPKNLSRTLEDVATLTSPFVPWNSCGAYMIATLGIAPWTFIPYCILNWSCPIFAAIYGYTGFGIAKIEEVENVT